MLVDIERLMSHVERLAEKPRPAESPALEAARRYVRGELERSGWTLEDDAVEGESDTGEFRRGVNVVARHPLWNTGERPLFCLGAHLDSRPESPGADDNASAVATLLEIARLLPECGPADAEKDFELVVFDLEEDGMLGGAAHARRTAEAGTNLWGMVSLEMLGFCDHSPNSQALPRSLVGLYPDTANFIAVIGNQNSGELIAAFSDGMRRAEGLPVETLQVPENGNYLQATRLSDHSPFWDAGYPALMITDTSFLRNPHYHLPSDTPETLDREFLQRVAEGCLQAVCGILQAIRDDG